MQIPKPNNEYDLTDRICANDGKAWNYRHVPPPFPYTLNRIFMNCRLTTNRPQNTEIQRRAGCGVRKPRASAGPVGDSKRPECQTDGAGAGRRARSLRSAETGIYKKFLSNRSGTRPDGAPDAGISPVPQPPAAFAHHAPRASGFRPSLTKYAQKFYNRIDKVVETL